MSAESDRVHCGSANVRATVIRDEDGGPRAVVFVEDVAALLLDYTLHHTAGCCDIADALRSGAEQLLATAERMAPA